MMDVQGMVSMMATALTASLRVWLTGVLDPQHIHELTPDPKAESEDAASASAAPLTSRSSFASYPWLTFHSF